MCQYTNQGRKFIDSLIDCIEGEHTWTRKIFEVFTIVSFTEIAFYRWNLLKRIKMDVFWWSPSNACLREKCKVAEKTEKEDFTVQKVRFYCFSSGIKSTPIIPFCSNVHEKAKYYINQYNCKALKYTQLSIHYSTVTLVNGFIWILFTAREDRLQRVVKMYTINSRLAVAIRVTQAHFWSTKPWSERFDPGKKDKLAMLTTEALICGRGLEKST